MNEVSEQTPDKAQPKRIVHMVVVLFIFLLLVLAITPSIVARLPIRDVVLNSLQADPYLVTSTGSASFGWMSSTELNNISVRSLDARVDMSVNKVLSSSSLPKLWFDAPEIGIVDIDRLSIHVQLPLEETDEPIEEIGIQYEARLQDTNILVEYDGDDEPIIDLKGLNLVANVERDFTGAWIRLGQFALFEHRPLTPELCDEFLQLIDPVIADVTVVTGSASCHFENFFIPLHTTNDEEALRELKVKGVLTIHELTGDFKTPLLRGILRILADSHGVKMPKVIRLAEETKVHFEVRGGRIYHQGLTFGLPDISPKLSIRSKGSVGMDESLDLTVEVPKTLLSKSPLVANVESPPVIMRISGTIENPVVKEVQKTRDNDSE